MYIHMKGADVFLRFVRFELCICLSQPRHLNADGCLLWRIAVFLKYLCVKASKRQSPRDGIVMVELGSHSRTISEISQPSILLHRLVRAYLRYIQCADVYDQESHKRLWGRIMRFEACCAD